MVRGSRSFVPALLVLALVGCSRSCTEDQPSGGDAPAAGSASAAPSAAASAATPGAACTAHRAPPGTETAYTCLNPAAADRCAKGDVTACFPETRTRGNVALGAKCVLPTSSDAWRYELGDNCAPHPTTISPNAPKGSYCVAESGPGAYCTHDCSTDSDCSDVRRDGFTVACSGGGCLLRNGTKH